MASLPVLNGRQVVAIFESFGWKVVRQSSSHVIMTKEGEIATLSISDHKGSRRAHCEALSDQLT